MRGCFEELPQRSSYAASLKFEVVKGTTSGDLNPENDVDVLAGIDRSMYVYVPASGVYHAKQAPVLMVLRDDAGEGSAAALLRDLALDRLAEDNHFIVVFPNPLGTGWNYDAKPGRDDDAQFIVRCFAALKTSESGVAGFNGMIFHLGATPAGSAMAMTLASSSPLDAAALMIGDFPEDYQVKAGPSAQQVAWLYEANARAEAYLEAVDAPLSDGLDGMRVNVSNPCVRLVVSDEGLTAAALAQAWERVFAPTRRWRNDTYGIYQPRIDFAAKGYVAHVEDSGLGVNDGFAHTWYEYVPTRLRGTDDPIALVLYLHGINCVPLYGAEQSGWADLADRDGFAVVFPAPAIEERWNVWDDPRLPSDMDFLLALIDHMDEVHPIDRSRVYVSGFSMGSMMSNALAGAHPEAFAGAVALNGPNPGYLQTLDESVPWLLPFRRDSVVGTLPASDEKVSPVRRMVDAKLSVGTWRMPFVQFVGLLDGAGGAPKARVWPLTEDGGGMWPATIRLWLRYDNVLDELVLTGEGELGIDALEVAEECERFVHVTWEGADEGAPALYHFIGVRRMPHAVDLRALELGWDIVRRFCRNADGSLGRRA